QAAQCINHTLPVRQYGTRMVGAELPSTRKPRNNHVCEKCQDDFRNKRGYIKADPVTIFGSEYDPVDCVANDPRKKHHEGIDYTLYQRESNHVAIGNVANFMREYGARFILVKTLKHTRADGYQGRIAIPAGSKGIGLLRWKDPDFGHSNSGFFR